MKISYTVDGLKDDYANRSLVTAAVNDVYPCYPPVIWARSTASPEYGLDKPVGKGQGDLYRRQHLQLLVGRRVRGYRRRTPHLRGGLKYRIHCYFLGDFLYGSNVQFVRNDVLSITSKDETASSEENLSPASNLQKFPERHQL